MKAKIYENYVKNGRTDADKDELVRITGLSSDTIVTETLVIQRVKFRH